MDKERVEALTRANILQIGLAILFLGPIGYAFFRFVGFEDLSAGIAAEFILILIVFGWTGSYFYRVFTGKMTFVEQRKRYLQAYEKFKDVDPSIKFESLSVEDKAVLKQEIENQQESINSPPEH